MKNYLDLLKNRMDKDSLEKLLALDSPDIVDFVGEYAELCNPKSIFVRTDSAQDREYIRNKALSLGEEAALEINGHTVHFDGYSDQGRDKNCTRYLLPQDKNLGSHMNSIDREHGLAEVRGYLKNIMQGKEMFVCFFCLGPVNSDFSIHAIQLTDSAYVGHSEDILYRPGYAPFKNNKHPRDFFRFVHSAGELENKVSKNTDKRKVYIDLQDKLVYSVNTQYAGNTVGLKKLALRLAIDKASQEGWLAEHMFIMGVYNSKKEKVYFCGAYPSMCGKTSTAMVSGESIVGDDIAYLRIKDGKVYAVNVERGIFGIIKDVNAKDDAILFKALTRANEVIFSNVLVDAKQSPFWIGKNDSLPGHGVNYAGDWFPGKISKEGEEILPSHKNARYTINLKSLENVDENLENPQGVEVKGLIYGGRDTDTSVPVEQSLSWNHGIIIKAASLESETTAATLGQEGVRVFNPMSNIDFLSVSLGKYLEMNLEFGKKLKNAPFIFSVNYFLRDKQGKFLNAMQDKLIWLKWIRLRGDFKAGGLLTPTGIIPKYEDLAVLFKEVLKKDYSKENYFEQFTLRIPENLAKIERIRNIYETFNNIPAVLFEELEDQETRLNESLEKFGSYVNPETWEEVC